MARGDSKIGHVGWLGGGVLRNEIINIGGFMNRNSSEGVQRFGWSGKRVSRTIKIAYQKSY